MHFAYSQILHISVFRLLSTKKTIFLKKTVPKHLKTLYSSQMKTDNGNKLVKQYQSDITPNKFIRHHSPERKTNHREQIVQHGLTNAQKLVINQNRASAFAIRFGNESIKFNLRLTPSILLSGTSGGR
jgi:hypothetical protein